MIKYYYIPYEHEAVVSQKQTEWLGQSPDAFTIMTGAYDTEIVENDALVVYSSVKNQREKFLKKEFGVEGDDVTVKYNIIGFILEGELNEELEELKNSLSGVLEFDNANALKEFLKTV